MKITRSKWTPLFLSNFLGVFNDNFLKNCIIFIAVSWARPDWLTQSQLISVVSASLVIPYIFLSPIAGRFAVIYSKKKVFRICKLLEIPVLLVACMAFYQQWIMTAVLAVLLMGILSCIYSPAKYSLIRDIGGEEGVSFGSGIFEMMAFLGVLVGTVVASVVSDHYSITFISGLLIGLAVLGYLATSTIRAHELPEENEDTGHLNPIRFVVDSYRFARQHKHVNSAVLGASSFWLIGSMLQMNLVIHTRGIYHVDNSTIGIVMAVSAIGIALGCWVAGKISGKEVKKGLILVGTLGMSTFLSVLTFFHLPFQLYIALVFGVAFMGGIFQIPCLSIIQNSDLGRKLGAVIGYLNMFTFTLISLGAALFSATTYFTNENSYAVFGVILAICLLISFFFLKSSSEFWRETKALFRIIPNPSR
jgi:acyl-[acyl-carrier-protein]-phospholipid O-acyltransferase/long-chain-fatty-acid--[acyl-carrier-protein] ligase